MELIKSPSALAALCDRLCTQECIAVDTEFARDRTYFPHIGLIQIAGDGLIACIDPLAFDVKPQLSELLFNDAVTKVFHACLQDLEVLELTLGSKPCPIFDTQLANALMQEDHQISYAKLVDSELGIQLPKSETRTDWLKRPLTAAQLEYAADDVRYLLSLHRRQQQALDRLERSEWMQQDCDRLCRREFDNTDLSDSWKRVKGKERLRGVELAVLQEAARWREQRAMARDRPRRRILPDDLLVRIAVDQPRNTSELGAISGIDRFLNLSETDSFSEAVCSAYELAEPHWPTLERRKLTQQQSAALNATLSLLRQRAAELGVSAGMLCNRRDAEKLVLGQRDLPVLDGWRLDCVGSELLKLVLSGPKP